MNNSALSGRVGFIYVQRKIEFSNTLYLYDSINVYLTNIFKNCGV